MKVFRNANRFWVGECPQDATEVCDVPTLDDPRWIKGKPNEDGVKFLTLCPWFASGNLGAQVEERTDWEKHHNVNHPSFLGCKFYMPVSALVFSTYQ